MMYRLRRNDAAFGNDGTLRVMMVCLKAKLRSAYGTDIGNEERGITLSLPCLKGGGPP